MARRPEARRLARATAILGDESRLADASALAGLAQEAGVAPTTLAIAWVLANPVVTAPIIGASKPEQLTESLAAVEQPIAADLKKRLDELTAEYRRGDVAR